MRVLSVPSLAVAASVLSGVLPADEPRVLQSLRYPIAPEMVAVSPSGNQLACVNTSNLKVRRLQDDGRVGDTLRTMQLSSLHAVAFAPGGRSVICAAQGGQIHVIRRDTWEIESFRSPEGSIPCGIDVISQRPEAYIQYYDADGTAAAVDVRRKEVVEMVGPPFEHRWTGAGIAASPDGESVCALMDSTNYPHMSRVEVWSNPRQSREPRGYCPVSTPSGVCPGPDPEHIMVVSRTDGDVRVVRLADCLQAARVPLGLESASAVAHSRDGLYTVVADAPGSRLKVIWALDLRGVINGDVSALDVRSADLSLPCRPHYVCIHPTLPVAYVCSRDDRRIVVVHLAVPGT